MESLAEPSSVVPKINCPKRPGTPDLQCTICLGDIINTCNSDSCWHTFCFECLKHWSHVQPYCPLCKKIFKYIHYAFTSHGLHETYTVPSQEVVDNDMMNETILLDTDDEEIGTDTRRLLRPEFIEISSDDSDVEIGTDTRRQFRPEFIEISSDDSDCEIVDQQNSVQTFDLNRNQQSTSTGITNNLNRPNNRYNLRRRR